MPISPSDRLNNAPLVAVSPDIRDGRVRVAAAVLDAVVAAGGVPVILPPQPAIALQVLERSNGLILTGGDDPRMEAFGVATNQHSVLVHPNRQLLDLALIEAAMDRCALPVLAICLGMQYLGLVAGGTLHQHLPDVIDTAATHMHNALHNVDGSLGSGSVASHHRQALADAGSFNVIAHAEDGIIEAIEHPERPWVRGVQWHPERMGDTPLGQGLFKAFVQDMVGLP